MKKHALSILIIVFVISILFASAALADDTAEIHHRSEVGGYQLEYQFIDMMEKMKAMTDMGHSMESMTATHHLMVFIKNAQGEAVAADKVGFLITAPDGQDQKVMAMGMGGGHGADVNLSLPGKYTVKTKAVIGGQNLVDSFDYEIK